MLDAPGPRYQGDEKVYKVKHSVSCEKWYPTLNKFFDFLEKTLKIECKIAPHPKTRPPKFSKDFNYRSDNNSKWMTGPDLKKWIKVNKNYIGKF